MKTLTINCEQFDLNPGEISQLYRARKIYWCMDCQSYHATNDNDNAADEIEQLLTQSS
jgi:Zn-finger protein